MKSTSFFLVCNEKKKKKVTKSRKELSEPFFFFCRLLTNKSNADVLLCLIWKAPESFFRFEKGFLFFILKKVFFCGKYNSTF